MKDDVTKYVEEFARFYGHADLVSVEDAKHEHGVDWVEDTLTKVADEARKKERDRIEKQLRTLRTTDKRKYDVVLWADVISILKDK